MVDEVTLLVGLSRVCSDLMMTKNVCFSSPADASACHIKPHAYKLQFPVTQDTLLVFANLGFLIT